LGQKIPVFHQFKVPVFMQETEISPHPARKFYCARELRCDRENRDVGYRIAQRSSKIIKQEIDSRLDKI